jgi:hypothetical protein
MARPLGVLSVGPSVTTTEVEDIDGGPPVLHGTICSEFYKKYVGSNK